MNSRETEETAVRDETAFRRDYPLVWFLTLVGPFALTAGVLFVNYELAGINAIWRLISTAFATFFFFGKFVILGGSEGELLEVREFYAAEQLVVLVLYMDVMTACVLTSHLGFLFKLPVAGEKLKTLVHDGNLFCSRTDG